MLEPDIERYGTFARESALADFLEVQAMSGRSMSQQDLADYIIDSGWAGKGHALVAGPPQPLDLDHIWALEEDVLEDEDEDGAAIARTVFNVLRERQGTLAFPRYPFRVESSGVRCEASLECPYGFLLSASVAHAWKMASPQDPTVLLEDFVCRALTRLGYLTANPGNWRRHGNFDQRLLDAGQAIHLTPTPDAAFRARFAQDERVDVIGHRWLGDMRPGRWVVIGQVTCATSDDWTKKFREPSPSQWAKLLGMLVLPQHFLALPYHVPQQQFFLQVERGEGVLLDRLRLAQTDVILTDDERAVVGAVAGAEVLAA